MEQVNNSRGKTLRIIAGIALIICAILGAIHHILYLNALGVFSKSATGGSYFNFTFIHIINLFLLPYLGYILQIVLGVLLLKNNFKGVFIVAAVNFALSYLDITLSLFNYFYYTSNGHNISFPTVNIIISILSVGGLFYLAFVAFLRQKTNNRAAYVLSIIFFVITVYGYFTSMLNSIFASSSMVIPISMFIPLITLTADILLAVYLAFFANVKPPKTIKMSAGANVAYQDYGEQDLFKFIVLCIVTFGVWYYVWIYKTVKHLEIGGKSSDAGLELVLSLFVPFYYIYWLYKASKTVEGQLKAYGRPADDICALTLILGLLVGFLFGAAFLQHKINELANIKRTINMSANVNMNVNDNGTKN